MPDERRCERSRCVLDVNDTTMAWTRGRTRCMKQERAKGEERPFLNQTLGLRLLRPELVDCLWGKATQAMRAIDDAHWSILCTAGIEVHADR